MDAPQEACRFLETLQRLHQELHAADSGKQFQRKGQVDMQHIAETAARIAEPQPETYVPEQSRVAVADHACSPRAADVAEYRAADAHQPEWVPVCIEALFHGEYGTRCSRFVAQRIPAQAVVTAEQQL